VKSRPQPKYDWFGYGLWFGCGMIYGGTAGFILHFAVHNVEMSTWQILGCFAIFCLGGGFWWGRKYRRQWQQEIAEVEILREVLNCRDNSVRADRDNN